MPKYEHTNLSVKERAEIDNMNASISKTADTDPYAARVVELIRENSTLTHEIKVLRSTINKILTYLDLNIEEFTNYNTFVENCIKEASEEVKTVNEEE